MDEQAFPELIARVTRRIEGKPVDKALADFLNETFPPTGGLFADVRRACEEGERDGWICARGPDNLKFGRVLKPGPATHEFSVDVVRMTDVKGPHHSHPGGEIDMIMPVDGDARFDGHGAGWCVYDAGSAHFPTVTGGTAYVLYLLPGGRIEFTK